MGTYFLKYPFELLTLKKKIVISSQEHDPQKDFAGKVYIIFKVKCLLKIKLLSSLCENVEYIPLLTISTRGTTINGGETSGHFVGTCRGVGPLISNILWAHGLS